MNENKEKTAGNLANSVVEGYDYSVAVRMSGRAGAYSPTGGKGNAFEVMYSDKKNLSNLLKPDTTTTLTNSSTARQVDLVTKKGNRIIERIQCKDTPSAKGTMDTIKRVQNGQYRTTQLVGTSESAAAFNAKAPSQGVTKVMKDSSSTDAFNFKIGLEILAETTRLSATSTITVRSINKIIKYRTSIIPCINAE